LGVVDRDRAGCFADARSAIPTDGFARIRKGGPGFTRSDLLMINKTDLAPHVGAPLSIMERDDLAAIIAILSRAAMLALAPPASE